MGLDREFCVGELCCAILLAREDMPALKISSRDPGIYQQQ